MIIPRKKSKKYENVVDKKLFDSLKVIEEKLISYK